MYTGQNLIAKLLEYLIYIHFTTDDPLWLVHYILGTKFAWDLHRIIASKTLFDIKQALLWSVACINMTCMYISDNNCMKYKLAYELQPNFRFLFSISDLRVVHRERRECVTHYNEKFNKLCVIVRAISFVFLVWFHNKMYPKTMKQVNFGHVRLQFYPFFLFHFWFPGRQLQKHSIYQATTIFVARNNIWLQTNLYCNFPILNQKTFLKQTVDTTDWDIGSTKSTHGHVTKDIREPT